MNIVLAFVSFCFGCGSVTGEAKTKNQEDKLYYFIFFALQPIYLLYAFALELYGHIHATTDEDWWSNAVEMKLFSKN